MKPLCFLLILSALALPVSAAVNLYAKYSLGEPGSLGGSNIPQDTSGNGRHFQTAFGTGTVVSSTGVRPGSLAYLSTNPTAGDETLGFYGADFSALPADNFAFGVYARTTENTAGTRGDVFVLGNGGGRAKLSLESGGWRSSLDNVAYVGGPAAFLANEWVHLALIRQNGQSAFYVNGVQQGGTLANAPTHTNNGHLAISPGGATAFDGDMDEARVLTFTSNESTQRILSALMLPEPDRAVFGLLGLLFLACARKRKAR